MMETGSNRSSADLILKNGKILTMDGTRPQAEALAAREDKIIAVGSMAEIEPFVSPQTRMIDLKGKLADITVFSRDIMTIPEEEILSTQIAYTIIGGKVKYCRN